MGNCSPEVKYQVAYNKLFVDTSIPTLEKDVFKRLVVVRPDWTVSKTTSARARFKREIEVLRDLHFKFFPKYIDSGEHKDHLFFVMEELQPFDLPNTDVEVARFMDDICKAVETLHTEKWVHRDLKPGNIMRRGDGSYVR